MSLERLLREAGLAVRELLPIVGATLSPADIANLFGSLEDALAAYHIAAAYVGGADPANDALAFDRVYDRLGVQLMYLDQFEVAVLNDRAWDAGRVRRAISYTRAIQVPYWDAKTKFLPLPAMPGEGTICLYMCKCKWSIVTVNAEQGDYDCTWVLAADESCSTCLARAAEWSPLRIRGGQLG